MGDNMEEYELFDLIKKFFPEEIEIKEQEIHACLENKLSSREKVLLDIIENLQNSKKTTEPSNKSLRYFLSEDREEEEIINYFEKKGIKKNSRGQILSIQLKSDEELKNIVEYIRIMKINDLDFTSLNKNELSIYYRFSKDIEESFPRELVGLILSELSLEVQIGVSTIVEPIGVYKGQCEAKRALELAQRYKLGDSVVEYSKLSINQIIANLKDEDLKLLEKKIENAKFSMLDSDDIKTANIFLESNLNISEAARKLFIHRNTLIYRLEKIHKTTGYDLKVFKDAMNFRILILAYIYYNRVNFV